MRFIKQGDDYLDTKTGNIFERIGPHTYFDIENSLLWFEGDDEPSKTGGRLEGVDEEQIAFWDAVEVGRKIIEEEKKSKENV